MTKEQFEKAQEIHNERELVLDVENLLVNWKMADGQLNILTVIYGPNSHNAGATCNAICRCSQELQDRLIQVCRDYYHELNKQFDEL